MTCFLVFFFFSRVLNALRKEYGAVFIAHVSVCLCSFCLFLVDFFFLASCLYDIYTAQQENTARRNFRRNATVLSNLLIKIETWQLRANTCTERKKKKCGGAADTWNSVSVVRPGAD